MPHRSRRAPNRTTSETTVVFTPGNNNQVQIRVTNKSPEPCCPCIPGDESYADQVHEMRERPFGPEATSTPTNNLVVGGLDMDLSPIAPQSPAASPERTPQRRVGVPQGQPQLQVRPPQGSFGFDVPPQQPQQRLPVRNPIGDTPQAAWQTPHGSFQQISPQDNRIIPRRNLFGAGGALPHSPERFPVRNPLGDTLDQSGMAGNQSFGASPGRVAVRNPLGDTLDSPGNIPGPAMVRGNLAGASPGRAPVRHPLGDTLDQSGMAGNQSFGASPGRAPVRRPVNDTLDTPGNVPGRAMVRRNLFGASPGRAPVRNPLGDTLDHSGLVGNQSFGASPGRAPVRRPLNDTLDTPGNVPGRAMVRRNLFGASPGRAPVRNPLGDTLNDSSIPGNQSMGSFGQNVSRNLPDDELIRRNLLQASPRGFPVRNPAEDTLDSPGNIPRSPMVRRNLFGASPGRAPVRNPLGDTLDQSGVSGIQSFEASPRRFPVRNPHEDTLDTPGNVPGSPFGALPGRVPVRNPLGDTLDHSGNQSFGASPRRLPVRNPFDDTPDSPGNIPGSPIARRNPLGASPGRVPVRNPLGDTLDQSGMLENQSFGASPRRLPVRNPFNDTPDTPGNIPGSPMVRRNLFGASPGRAPVRNPLGDTLDESDMSGIQSFEASPLRLPVRNPHNDTLDTPGNIPGSPMARSPLGASPGRAPVRNPLGDTLDQSDMSVIHSFEASPRRLPVRNPFNDTLDTPGNIPDSPIFRRCPGRVPVRNPLGDTLDGNQSFVASPRGGPVRNPFNDTLDTPGNIPRSPMARRNLFGAPVRNPLGDTLDEIDLHGNQSWGSFGEADEEVIERNLSGASPRGFPVRNPFDDTPDSPGNMPGPAMVRRNLFGASPGRAPVRNPLGDTLDQSGMSGIQPFEASPRRVPVRNPYNDTFDTPGNIPGPAMVRGASPGRVPVRNPLGDTLDRSGMSPGRAPVRNPFENTLDTPGLYNVGRNFSGGFPGRAAVRNPLGDTLDQSDIPGNQSLGSFGRNPPENVPNRAGVRRNLFGASPQQNISGGIAEISAYNPQGSFAQGNLTGTPQSFANRQNQLSFNRNMSDNLIQSPGNNFGEGAITSTPIRRQNQSASWANESQATPASFENRGNSFGTPIRPNISEPGTPHISVASGERTPENSIDPLRAGTGRMKPKQLFGPSFEEVSQRAEEVDALRDEDNDIVPMELTQPDPRVPVSDLHKFIDGVQEPPMPPVPTLPTLPSTEVLDRVAKLCTQPLQLYIEMGSVIRSRHPRFYGPETGPIDEEETIEIQKLQRIMHRIRNRLFSEFGNIFNYEEKNKNNNNIVELPEVSSREAKKITLVTCRHQNHTKLLVMGAVETAAPNPVDDYAKTAIREEIVACRAEFHNAIEDIVMIGHPGIPLGTEINSATLQELDFNLSEHGPRVDWVWGLQEMDPALVGQAALLRPLSPGRNPAQAASPAAPRPGPAGELHPSAAARAGPSAAQPEGTPQGRRIPRQPAAGAQPEGTPQGRRIPAPPAVGAQPEGTPQGRRIPAPPAVGAQPVGPPQGPRTAAPPAVGAQAEGPPQGPRTPAPPAGAQAPGNQTAADTSEAMATLQPAPGVVLERRMVKTPVPGDSNYSPITIIPLIELTPPPAELGLPNEESYDKIARYVTESLRGHINFCRNVNDILKKLFATDPHKYTQRIDVLQLNLQNSKDRMFNEFYEIYEKVVNNELRELPRVYASTTAKNLTRVVCQQKIKLREIQENNEDPAARALYDQQLSAFRIEFNTEVDRIVFNEQAMSPIRRPIIENQIGAIEGLLDRQMNEQRELVSRQLDERREQGNTVELQERQLAEAQHLSNRQIDELNRRLDDVVDERDEMDASNALNALNGPNATGTGTGNAFGCFCNDFNNNELVPKPDKTADCYCICKGMLPSPKELAQVEQTEVEDMFRTLKRWQINRREVVGACISRKARRGQ